MGPGVVNDVMHRRRELKIFEIWKKSVCWVFASKEESWLSELAEALRRVPHLVGRRWKSQHRKIVYLSPHVEKPFNSKVIKSFVPELRSRKCFFVFRDSYVIYIWVMNILCTFHVFMYGYVTLWNISLHHSLGYIIKEMISYISHFSLIIFYYLVW